MFIRDLLKLVPFGGLCYARYVYHDLDSHPNNDHTPLKIKAAFFLPDRINGIKKFSADELANQELVIRDGLLHTKSSSKPLHDADLIYVMTKNNKIFVTNPKRRAVNHTSIGSKLDVICAGEMKAANGELRTLNENSGHYRPQNRVHLIERALLKAGVRFHSNYERHGFYEARRLKKLETTQNTCLGTALVRKAAAG